MPKQVSVEISVFPTVEKNLPLYERGYHFEIKVSTSHAPSPSRVMRSVRAYKSEGSARESARQTINNLRLFFTGEE